MAVQTAISTRSFIDSIGVNTHIGFVNYGYQNLTTVAASINYLGLKNPRDSAQTAADATTWQQIANATGAKFNHYIAETSPAGMATTASDNAMVMQTSDGSYWVSLWNENDVAHSVTLTLPATAQFHVFDPLTGTQAVSTASAATTTVSVSDHPVLVEI